jgi:hypothetical protein
MPGIHLYNELFSFASFKPIDLDPSTSTDFSGETVSPNTIFRYALNGDEDQCMPDASFLQRANPIVEGRDEDMMAESGMQQQQQQQQQYQHMYHRHIVSPLPLCVDERDQAVSFSLSYRMEETVDPSVTVDYSQYFAHQTMQINNTAVLLDCDDFSISSQEASTISDDLGLESFSDNPASFWEDGLDFSPPAIRSESPTQVSLGTQSSTSDDQQQQHSDGSTN